MAKATTKAKSKAGKKGGAKRSTAKKSTARKPAAKTRSTAAAGRSDKSVQAFREALDRSVTLSRDRIQEVVDDAVKRGRMTRGDANELVSRLVSRSRKQSDDLMRDLEKLLEQARKEVETRVEPARKRAEAAVEGLGRAARDAADKPLARADKLRRRAGGPGAPITGYDNLTAAQVKTRLTDLSKPELRKVRTQEKNGKARKSILADIEKRLG